MERRVCRDLAKKGGQTGITILYSRPLVYLVVFLDKGLCVEQLIE